MTISTQHSALVTRHSPEIIQQLSLYEKLLLMRLAEERIQKEYSKDEIKTPVHLGIGAEAIALGILNSLPKSTKVFGTYRSHNLYLSLCDDLESFFGELYGKVTGCAKGKAGSMHLSAPEHNLVMTSAVVGTTVPVAVGSAFASAYRKSDDLTVAFFGDGAIEEGVFWESINFACLKKLKILFVCEDNELAIHAFKKGRQGFSSIGEVLKGFPCYYLRGEGYHLENVIRLTQEAHAAMANQSGPAFLHLDYFRFLQHVGTLEDFDDGYRPRPKELEKLDPVKNFERTLLERGVTSTELGALKDRIDARIDQAIQKAQEAPFAEPSELYSDVYADQGQGGGGQPVFRRRNHCSSLNLD